MEVKKIAGRIKRIRREYAEREGKKFTQEDFAKILGISIHTIKALEIGKNQITFDKVNLFKEKLGINPTWILYGEGQMFLEDDANSLSSIPYYEDIRASAGFGAINGNVAEPEHFLLPPKFLQNCQRSTTEAINVSGDSMYPNLKDGDVMFIDRGDIEIKEGEVYIVRVENEVYVKRLFRVPGKLLARSDNSDYPEFELKDNYEILGHVVYKMERV